MFCTRWRGLTKANGVMEAIDDHEYSGGLISLLKAAKRFVVANTKMMWRKAPDRRIEYPEYPERAYEECIVNGLIHRDYLELGGELHVDIFDDRMEFFSPGAMPSGKTAENADLRRVSSLRRNPVIADLFQRLDLMERRGSGFGKIIDAYAFESEKRGRVLKPTFSSGAMGFTMVLPNLNYGLDANTLAGVENGVENGVEKSAEKSTEKIIRHLAENPHATQNELAVVTGLSVRGVEKNLSRLKASGIIRRVGPDKGGHWEVVK